ncbi:hypothetical protein [Alkalihalobacterium bogoriense]|uniref:hypothetical protein n=1 Tax=Alkalihalobacterium bogoriense TaxID=246272 RepID=UPI00047EAF37|nr:hypothetical protein [Alkalihalobacterium bogoriense]
MAEITYKPIIEAEFKVSGTYSICIDKCIRLVDGKEDGEQVVMRYKKNGMRVPRQPAFDEISITKAIIEAYKKGVFSREALDLLKKEIVEIE